MSEMGGIPSRAYRPYTPAEVQKIAEGAMWVLQNVGIQVNSRPARELLLGAGARAARGEVVLIPEDLVRWAVDQAPSQVVLYGREERHHLTLAGAKVYFGTGGTVLYTLDLETGERRPTTLRDVARVGRLVDALDNVHFYLLPLYPTDLPKEKVDLNRFYAGLTNTTKHIMGGIYTAEGLQQAIRLSETVAGGPEALRERPIVSFITCTVAPLRLDATYTDFLMEIARRGLPVAIPSEVVAGVTAPMTVAGATVVQLAETLAGLVVAQLTRPGTPTLLGTVSTVMDPRRAGYLAGAVEMGLMQAGMAQLAQHYELPLYATAGMSDAKVPDAQAGYEKALTALLVALAGANFIHDAAGPLEFCTTVAYEQYVIDDEILGMVMRALRGVEVSDETLALGAIAEVGPGGHFLTHRHTLNHLRSELFTPRVSDRELRERWEAQGAQNTRARARQLARRLLSDHRPPGLPPAAEARVRSEFPGIELPEEEARP
ncbi:MAG: trimethylamine methyltransferase family protein [Candidatus Bipolaricaulaceae bacterium]